MSKGFLVQSPNGIQGKISENAIDALVYKAIIEIVSNNVKNKGEFSTTYGDVSKKVQEYVGLQTDGRADSDFLVHWNGELRLSLGRISKDCNDRKLPPITMLVENQNNEVSGNGFIICQDGLQNENFKKSWDNLAKNNLNDFKKIIDFVQKIIAHSYGIEKE